MSLAAIPAYLLARRVVPARLALLAAVLAVALPSMVYTATVMTENAFYPVFLLAACASCAMLERPTWRAQVGSSPQSRWRSRPALRRSRSCLRPSRRRCCSACSRGGPACRRCGRTGCCTRSWAPARLLAVAAQIARGRSLSALLGAYAVVGDQSLRRGQAAALPGSTTWPSSTSTSASIPVAAPIVLAGALPLARPPAAGAARGHARARLLVRGRRRRRSPPSSPNRIQERNMFVVAPLLPRAPARLGRARGATAARLARRRRGRRRRFSSSRSPSRRFIDDLGGLGHADAAAVVGWS